MDRHCEKLFGWPLIAIVAFIVIIHVVGFVGATCRVKWLFRVYSAFVFILPLLVFGFVVFTMLVQSKGNANIIPGKRYEEYRLQDFSNWLQNWVKRSSHWNCVKSCIQDSNACNKLGVDSANVVDKEFYKKKLSPIESGCCKPPTSCNFGYVNATYWISTTGSFSDMDCSRWSNEEDQLCYDCDSCKVGVLLRTQNEWLFMGLTLVPIFGIICGVAYFVLREKHLNMRAASKTYPYDSN